jgi:O-antigen ligase
MNKLSNDALDHPVKQLADKSILWVAVFWGCCIVMPVGMQYLSLFLLLILMLASGRWKESMKVFHQQRLWTFSVFAFVGITLATLATQEKHYPETISNLWHGFRIVLTLMVGLSLRAHEARKALLAAVVALCLMSLLVLFNRVGLLHQAPAIALKLIPDSGNRRIGFSILLAMLVVAFLRIPNKGTGWLSVWPLGIGGLALAMNLLVITQRTAFLGLAVGLLCLANAYWRNRLPNILTAGLSILVATAVSFYSIDAVHDTFKNGFVEIEQASKGLVDSNASMNVRYHMYTQTTDMMLERPLQGWGIGAWNDQWRQRTNPTFRGFNMPHNDFLWMGAQAGWPGALAWLAMMLSLCWMGWKNNNAVGHVAFSIACIALMSSMFNSATRDASIGLPMLFVVAAAIAWARDPQSKRH